MTRGRNGAFHWLSSDCHNFSHLFELYPELFLGRYIAVTSNDSGIPDLTPARQELGWRFDSGVLYSPCLTTPDLLTTIPHQLEGPDGPSFDEYYLLEEPMPLGATSRKLPLLLSEPEQSNLLTVFVNMYFELELNPPHELEPYLWAQLSRIRPFAYLSDGSTCITFVSESEAIVSTLWQRLLDSPEAQEPDPEGITPN
jgi:hypothetical protein